ncbi:MAG: PEP-CTERM sorting domain-containing protein [Akkermansia sp.]|nr:PEP-CTERM sorting domain-containing protein [Akkermansia sp.]
MRLHLPKGLLAALLAACFALPAGAEITTTPLTSLEVDGVTLPTGTYKQVTTDNANSMTNLESADVTFFKSNGTGDANQRFKVTSAEQVSSAGTLVVAEATVDGATSKTSAGQLYFSRWVGGNPGYDDSPLTISNDIIIGSTASECALRFSDSNQASRPITLTGNITLAQDAKICIDGTTSYAYMTGNINGTNKTLTILKPGGNVSDGGTLTLGDGTTGKTLTLGGLTMSNKTSVVMNYKDATIGTLKLESTADTPFSITGGHTEVTGAITIKNGKQITVASGATLTHDGFSYDGSTIATPTAGTALSLYGNATVTGGTLTQKENSSGESFKGIGATLSNVKLVNTSGLELRLNSKATLSAIDIGGKLQVNSKTTVSGATNVSGTVEVTSGIEFTMGNSATLSGTGTLKNSGGTLTLTNGSRFSGTLESAGGSLSVSGGLGSLKAVKASDGATLILSGPEATSSISIEEVVIAGEAWITACNEKYDPIEVEATKVQIGAGGGSLSGSLSITAGGTLTLDASAGATSEQGGTKGLATTGSLTLGSGLTLDLLNLGKLTTNDSLKLFSGVTSLTFTQLNETGVGPSTTKTDAITIEDKLDASTVFSGLGKDDFWLTYTGTADGGIVALVAQRDVPEPTTATLSLLALMGLAARRRRKA